MSVKRPMKEIETGIYAYFTEDGLIDLAVGLVILGFGGLLFLDLPVFTGVLGVVPLGLWYLGKRCITAPRIGVIRPGQTIERKLKGFLLTMVIVGGGVLPLFLLMRSGGQSSSEYSLLLFAMILAVGLSSLGLALKVNRLYIYAIALFFAMANGSVFNRAVAGSDLFVLSVIVTGVIITLAGILILIRFMLRYPVVKEGV